jgi:hypothetical protein
LTSNVSSSSLIEESVSPSVFPSSGDVYEFSTTTSYSSISDVTVTDIPLSPSQQASQVRKQVESDLQKWQEKFTIIANGGNEDLRALISEIVESQMESGVRLGQGLVLALKTVADNETSSLMAQISRLVQALPIDSAVQDGENTKADVLKAVRSAGLAIRDHAHALREWYNAFDQDLLRNISMVSESALDVLENRPYLSLQEIGIRWAWMDDITYQDWENYRALRRQFDNWRNELRDIGLHHEKVEEARNLANEILLQGMVVAEDAAKELSRLKEAGQREIEFRVLSSESDIAAGSSHPSIQSGSAKMENISSAGNGVVALDKSRSFFENPAISESAFPDNRLPVSKGWDAAPVDDQSESSQQSRTFTGQTTDHHVKTTKSAAEAPLDSISIIAASRLREDLALASAQYSDFKVSVSSTATSGQDQILLDAQRRYYEAIGLAHDRYSAFMYSASQAVSTFTTPTPPHGDSRNLIDNAESGFVEAASLASASLATVMTSTSPAMISNAEDNVHNIIKDASARYSAAISAAAASLSSATASASSAIYLASTGTRKHMASRKSNSVISKMSEGTYFTPLLHTQQESGHKSVQHSNFFSEPIAEAESDCTHRLQYSYETPYSLSTMSSAALSALGPDEPGSPSTKTHVTPSPSVADIPSSVNEQPNSAGDATSICAYDSSVTVSEQIVSASESAYAPVSSQLVEPV